MKKKIDKYVPVLSKTYRPLLANNQIEKYKMDSKGCFLHSDTPVYVPSKTILWK